ncbi:hypothetical protein O181_091242 [Austropuccinia psidii MF-1]|uniref:Uncharacterized protein n=1 Tax=Austropuccinia psidii MF-1 TaxID=1389203 RepID=A0A9Q3P8G2_9BASI|nr:hypothetical protein [Austropuccinia psidii MF-1]
MEVCNFPDCRKFCFTNEDGQQYQGVLLKLSEDSSEETSQSSFGFSESNKSQTKNKNLASELILGGVSRQKCQLAREYILQLFKVCQDNVKSQNFALKFPKDVRTIIKKLNLNPQLQQHILCPRCYCLYDLEIAPSDCGYQEFPQALPCGEYLFISPIINPFPEIQRLSQHHPQSFHFLTKRKPHSIYIHQNLSCWLKWFVPQVEDAIELWNQQTNSQKVPISDYQHSKACNELYPKSPTSQDSAMPLAFSLFVEWFNPLSNKLAGKKVSLWVL